MVVWYLQKKTQQLEAGLCCNPVSRPTDARLRFSLYQNFPMVGSVLRGGGGVGKHHPGKKMRKERPTNQLFVPSTNAKKCTHTIEWYMYTLRQDG